MNRMVLPVLYCLSLCIHAPAQTKIACIGNSITAGYGSTSYTVKLQTLLGNSYLVENDGVSGTTLLKQGDNPYWKNGRLPQVFKFKPDIVTIKLGTNDTKSQNWNSHGTEFKKDYEALIDTLGTLAKKPDVWIILPVPVWSNSYGIRDSILNKILPILLQIAEERNLPVIDANTPFKQAKNLFSDGVHPTATGADSIAAIFYRAIKEKTDIAFRPRTEAAPLRQMPARPLCLLDNHVGTTAGQTGDLPCALFDMRGRLIDRWGSGAVPGNVSQPAGMRVAVRKWR
jgi:acyl-CoA thioesterase I